MRGPTNQANNSSWNLDLVANFTFQIKNTPQSINLASKHYRIRFQTFMTCSGDARSPVYELPILKLHRCMTHELSEDCRSIELFTLIHVEFQFHQESQWETNRMQKRPACLTFLPCTWLNNQQTLPLGPEVSATEEINM